MKFTLQIELGNAIQTGPDIAERLEALAQWLRSAGYTPIGPENGKLGDLNGKTVGSWEVK